MSDLAHGFAGQRPLRCVVIGAGGQLGRALLAAPRRADERIVGMTHAELDVSDRAAVAAALTEMHPDLVVNAAAYTAVDRAESEPALAFAVNRDGAANIAEACAATDAALIHLSTDYVFDGGKRGAYDEGDEPGPLSVYGLSKAAGEHLVRERHERHVIIRTSWLFGADGHNFVKTVAKLAQERDELRVVADQRGCPTAAADLAVAIFNLARAMRAEPRVVGLFHYAGAEPVSWHGLAEAVVREIAPRLHRYPRVIPITTTDYPTPARRPRNSVLDCRKITELGIAPAAWRPSLRAVVDHLFQRDDRRLIPTSRSVPCPIFS